MSPEQARTGSIDGRTDVYSLGATLYELLTLRPPFDGRSAAELIDQIGETEPVCPQRDRPSRAARPGNDRAQDAREAAGRPLRDRRRARRRPGEVSQSRARQGPADQHRGRLWRVARRHPGITTVSTAAAAAMLAIATFAYVRVVAERDEAIRATTQKEDALESREDAYRQTRAAMKRATTAAGAVCRLDRGSRPAQSGPGVDSQSGRA